MLSMADFDLKKFFSSWRTYLLAVLVAVAVALLWCVPPLQVEQIRGRFDKPDAYRLANLEDAYRRTLAQILGGLGLLYGLYLAQRRIAAMEDNVRVAQDNVRVAQEGQVTERFTRAIAQLGDDKMAIRLGGIYALERLAKDSEKDHGPIMEVLTAYVRKKAPKQEEDTQNGAEKPPTDIQAILTVIGRRETTGNNRGNDPLNLSCTRLVRADLTDANLSGTILVEADLRQAYMNGANLAGADLLIANLSGAILTRAKNLTAKQVRQATNWCKAHLPDSLSYLKDTPEAPV